MYEVYTDDHHHGCGGGAYQDVEVEEDGERDARYDAMHQRVAEESHPAEHDPGPDHGQCDGRKGATQECPLLEGKFEWIEEEFHGQPANASAILLALVRIMSAIVKAAEPSISEPTKSSTTSTG